MSLAHRLRSYSSAATLLMGVLAFASLALVVPPGQNAQAADAPPRATTGFQTTERLILNISVPAVPAPPRADLRVELVGPDKKVIVDALRQGQVQPRRHDRALEFSPVTISSGSIIVRTSLGAPRARRH